MGSLRLVRVFGIDVKVHSTFLLALGLGAIQWSGFGLRGAAFGVLMIALLFVCVVLHELGHSVVANAFGIPVKEIILLPIGGISQMTKRPTKPTQELVIAIVGPLVNVVIALALAGIGFLWLGPEGIRTAFGTLSRATPSATTLWVALMTSNIALAVFNMLPALPMDGGRVLRSLLSLVVGPSRATSIASVVARLLAGAMFIFALLTGQLVLGLIAVFVFFGARAEVREEQLSGALTGVTSGQAINPKASTLTPDTTLGVALQTLVWNTQPAFAVVHGDRLVGVVSRQRLMQSARELGPYAYVAAVMERDLPTISPEMPLSEARQRMNETGSVWIAVQAGNEFLGLITEHELAQQAAIADVLSRYGPRGGQPRGEEGGQRPIPHR
jgi:Zn-dependent protease